MTDVWRLYYLVDQGGSAQDDLDGLTFDYILCRLQSKQGGEAAVAIPSSWLTSQCILSVKENMERFK